MLAAHSGSQGLWSRYGSWAGDRAAVASRITVGGIIAYIGDLNRLLSSPDRAITGHEFLHGNDSEKANTKEYSYRQSAVRYPDDSFDLMS